MSNSQQKTKQNPVQLYILHDTIKQFANPISKTTFEALPRIYGKKKKKKYAVKYEFQQKNKQTLRPKAYPVHHCIQSNERFTESRGIVRELELDNPTSTRRFKTEIRNSIKESTAKLSKPKNEMCNRRYCFCNKQHNQRLAMSQSKDELKPTHQRGRSIRLPEISKDFEPDDVQSRHKVGMSRLQLDGSRKKRPFTLLDLLRSNQKTDPFDKATESPERTQRKTEGQDMPNEALPQIKHAQSVFVQTQFDYSEETLINNQKGKNFSKNIHQLKNDKDDDNDPNLEEQEEMPQELQQNTEKHQNQSVSKVIKDENGVLDEGESKQELNEKIQPQQIQEQKNGSALRKQNLQSAQNQIDNLKVSRSASKAQQYDVNRNKNLQNRLAQLKQHYQNNESGSDIDDSRSIASSMSSASISKHVFEKGKNTNTVFHALNRQERTNSFDSKVRVKSQRLQKQQSPEQKKKQKFTFQKKHGLFVIPEQDEYVTYLKDYEPMSQKFKLKQVIKSENFKVVKSEEGVYFGEMVDEQKHGKGIMVTEKTIFQGKYRKDIKIQGCQKNIDGVYRGEFVNGLREGYGTFQWHNGEVFQGEWKNGTKNGFGTWKSPKGDFYEGEWKMNRQHGKGVFKHRLSTYRGYFVDFLKNGQGEEIFTNGDKYIGSYKQGKPYGKGKYQWADGSYYEGQFIKGVRQGYGIWKYINGTVYEGEFKNDFKTGKGKEKYKTGQRFEGIFKQGQKYEGVLYDSNNIAIQITNEI